MNTNVIRTLTIRAQTPGVDQATASLKGMAQAQEQVAIASEKTTRALLSMERTINNQKRSLDISFRSAQDFARAQRELQRVDEANRLSLVDVGATALTTAGHLKLLAAAGYALSPAFRGFVNAGVAQSFEMMGITAATAARSVTSFGATTLAFAARVGAILAPPIAAWVTLNYLIERGSQLLADHARRQEALFAPAAAKQLEVLTQFQTSQLTAEQARLAGELSDRLAEAKRQLGDMKFLQLDVTNAALGLQSIWVGIVERIAEASRLLGMLPSIVPDWLTSLGSLPSLLPQTASMIVTGMQMKMGITPTPPVDPLAAASAAARVNLSAGLGVRNIGIEGAPIGNTFAARWSDAIAQLSKAPKADVGVSTVNALTRAYDNLIQRARDRIDELKLEAATAGLTGDAVLKLKIMHELERAAKKDNIAVTDQLRASWKGLADELANATREAAGARLLSDVLFERTQLGRTSTEQAVASALRSANIDAASAQGQIIAQQMRLNEELRLSRDLASDFAVGFVRDLRAGRSATEALGNALTRLSDKLIEMAVQDLVTKAFGGLSGIGTAPAAAGGNLIGGLLNFLPSLFGFRLFHAGGLGYEAGSTRYLYAMDLSSLPRFHDGRAPGVGADEVPAIIRRDEGVFTPGQMRAMGGVTVNFTSSPTFIGADPASEARLRAEIRLSERRILQAVPSVVAAARAKAPGLLRG